MPMTNAEIPHPLPPLRVLVTGSRSLSHAGTTYVWTVLDRACADALADDRPIVIVQGECPSGGVDKAARVWAENMPGATHEPHPADWDRHGKAAGVIRNAEMVESGAEMCLAFPRRGSRGTWDCIRKSADAGIPVSIYPLGIYLPEGAS